MATVVTMILQRGQFKKLPVLVRISLIGFILYELIVLVCEVYEVTRGFDKFTGVALNVSFAIFLLNHLLFVLHYVEVAWLYSLTFQEPTEEIDRQIRRKKRCLHIAFVLAGAMVAALYFASAFFVAEFVCLPSFARVRLSISVLLHLCTYFLSPLHSYVK